MNNETLKIGSLNIQNIKPNRLCQNIDIIINTINSENYDILGTQELTKKLTKKIKQNLTNYKIYGKYRFTNCPLINLIPEISDYNENNSILTKLEVIKTKTIRLPWSFETVPRIATIAIIKTRNKKELCFINTHLDYRHKSAKTKQLLRLPKIITKYLKDYPVILTGDFNSSIGQPHFDNFVNELKLLGVNRVEINKPTHRTHKVSIDHIFISKDFEVIKSDVVEDTLMNEVTDHYGIYALIKLKKI